ncbi:uncharacterized protein [Leuresthes tenuis]|uniref:uncharacterized protein n=1 Tax=Leuresthes tenuis TaxID=355514 RepID=UPI003B50DE88
MRAASCCWVPTRNSVSNWRLNTLVDLGIRSDTREPNRSPDIAILPFMRVPQNCPRTYKLASFDPDGDRVRCRYGNMRGVECGGCNQPSGFHLDQDSCTLHYQYSPADPRVYGFEMVVEDYSQGHIDLFYSDGSQSHKHPLLARRKRQAVWGQTTTAPTTTQQPWWWWWGHTTTAPTTTQQPWWWWGHTTTAPTTTQQPWWWWGHTTTAPTTTQQPWWWWGHTTTAPTTTQQPWWWWGHTTTAPTITQQPWWWWGHTTTAPTTTQQPWRWWWQSTTPATVYATSTPRWWWGQTTTAPITTQQPWWWWGHTTTAPTTTQQPWRWWWQSTTTQRPTTTTRRPTTTTRRPTTTTRTPTTTTQRPTTTTQRPTTTRSYRTSSPAYVNTPPLSKLPLQFSLLVDPPVPSCQEGVYLPKFLSPTPANGARIQAEVNKELEIRIRAQATHSVLQDLITSGPTNITMHRTTHDEFVIRWTPIADDLGDHYPICFAVESATGSAINSYQTPPQSHSHSHFHATPTSQSGVYQSEMRCVVVDVRKEQIKAKVTCSESTMTVEVDKSSFFGLQEDHLRLSDSSNTACSLERYSNSTHIIGVIPLNACGTQIEEDDDNLIFKNEITTVQDNNSELITRKHLVEARFYCQYPKNGNVTLGFTAHRKNVTVWEKGFGTFTYQFEFYPDSQFRTRIDPNSYPLEYDIGSRIHMQIEASSSVNNTEMFVESCTAAPYDNPNYHPTYSIIENGCTVDPTVQIYSPSDDKQFKFSMEAFKFIGLHDQVYISCSVMMCEAGNPNTRCAQGCMNSTWFNGHNHRHHKREAVIQSAKHLVSQGPLRLRRSADSSGGSVVNLNLNLVFIAGCLLAAVGMICGVIMYKTKTSQVKYQPLPSCES